MKNVLIVVAAASTQPDSMNWLPLRDAIRPYVDDAVVDMTSLTQLVFDISNDDCHVVDSVTGRDVASYDFVVIRNVGKTVELGITLAQYLTMKDIPFTDEYLESRGAGKLACAMLRRRSGISTPRTVYALASLLGEYISTSGALQYPFVLKADNGRKGRDNYLVTSNDDLAQKLNAQPDVAFIAQEFIENNGDYRALVMGDKIALVIRRTASGDSHLNNTSQGGSAEVVDVSTFSNDVQAEILTSAKVEGLQVAGVDIIFDKHTNKHYFLEVNRAPQIGTGAFADQKIAAYGAMINERIHNV
jgi:glutathione synthase/RimK-type ligase-like ATP-grasp enzyme